MKKNKSAKMHPILKDAFVSSQKHLCFRSLRTDENVGNGIVCKDASSPLTVGEHISRGNTPSSWISISLSIISTVYWALRTNANSCRIAVIDLTKLTKATVVDASNGIEGVGSMMNNAAKSSFEMCVQYVIPKEAIVDIISTAEILSILNENWHSTVPEISTDGYLNCIECKYLTKPGLTALKAALGNVFHKVEMLCKDAEHYLQYREEMLNSLRLIYTVNRDLKNPLQYDFM